MRDVAGLVAAQAGRAREWLAALVAVDSEAPGEAAAQKLLAEIATSVGLTPVLTSADPDGLLSDDPRFIPTGLPYQDRPNCVIAVPGSAGGPLVCNVHIDTVAVGEGWTRNPFGELDGDRFHGRGACDAKGSLVAALVAAATLRTLDPRTHRPFEIHSVIDEEPGGNGTLALVRQRSDRRPPWLAVVMEPTGLDLFTGHRGMLWYGLRCVGQQAHGSTATGVNAIERAADVVDAVRRLNLDLSRWPAGDYGQPRMNVGVINGGHEVYTTPGTCQLEVSARYAPGERDRVDRALHEAVAAAVPPGAVETLFLRDFDAAETPPDDPAVQAALTALRAHRPAGRVGRLGGTCDMRHYRNLLGAPSVIFGPGDLADAHGPAEHVDLADVLVAARVLVELAIAEVGAP